MIKPTMLYCVGVMMGACLLTAYAMPGFEVADNNNQTDPGILVQCWHNVHGFMLDLIPDDRNCNRFYYCVHTGSASGATEPQLRLCAPSGNGTQRLYYDFKKCRCEHSSEGCYKDENIEDFFICANPANQSDESAEVFE